MDYNLLTAVHPRTFASLKMDARREQEYYDGAAESSALLEKAAAAIESVKHWARAFLALTQSARGNFGHGLTTHKALH
jgi:hypothetical protein